MVRILTLPPKQDTICEFNFLIMGSIIARKENKLFFKNEEPSDNLSLKNMEYRTKWYPQLEELGET